jgi:hypothetical protein
MRQLYIPFLVTILALGCQSTIKGGAGEPCNLSDCTLFACNNECDPTLVCNDEFICQAPPNMVPDGGDCDGDSVCSAGLFCRLKRCAPQIGDGGACDGDPGACAAGLTCTDFCSGGICSAVPTCSPRTSGFACTNVCSAGILVCAPFGSATPCPGGGP